MNLHELCNTFYKLAAIQHPPRNLRSFVENLKKKISLFHLKINEVCSSVDRTSDGFYDYMSDFMSPIRSGDIDFIYYRNKNIKNSVDNINECIDYISNKNDIPLNRYLEAISDSLKHIAEDISPVVIEIEPKLSEAQETYKKASRENFSNYYSGISPDFGEDVFNCIKMLQEMLLLCESAHKKLVEQVRLNRAQEGNSAPVTDDVEALYHTSINAKQIATSGFSKTREKVEGLGGSNTSKSGKEGISFTSDLYVAKEIARCLREVIMIANGELDAGTIYSWSSNPEKLVESFNSITGNWSENMSPQKTMDFYSNYLWLEKGRYNPVFFGVNVDVFKGKNYSDAGIIVADVDMKNPDIGFYPAMSEWRVPVEAVLEIKKVIY